MKKRDPAPGEQRGIGKTFTRTLIPNPPLVNARFVAVLAHFPPEPVRIGWATWGNEAEARPRETAHEELSKSGTLIQMIDVARKGRS